MGFIKAFTGALGGTFADQWKDYYLPQSNIPATAAICQAVPKGTNAGRGENYKGSENVITNGSKIVVPEGMALITLQDGAITGMIAEPGGFEFKSDDPNSQSISQEVDYYQQQLDNHGKDLNLVDNQQLNKQHSM